MFPTFCYVLTQKSLLVQKELFDALNMILKFTTGRYFEVLSKIINYTQRITRGINGYDF